MLNNPNADQLELDFCAYHTHPNEELEQIELIPNGKTIQVNDENKN